MYAIVEIAGHQYKVQKDQQIYVNRLQSEEGSKVNFDKVLLVDNNGKDHCWRPGYRRYEGDRSCRETPQRRQSNRIQKEAQKGLPEEKWFPCLI
jgi:ribosomal protein L21